MPLFVSDKRRGLIENLADFYPEAKWQRRVAHRNMPTKASTGKVKEVAAIPKAIDAQRDR